MRSTKLSSAIWIGFVRIALFVISISIAKFEVHIIGLQLVMILTFPCFFFSLFDKVWFQQNGSPQIQTYYIPKDILGVLNHERNKVNAGDIRVWKSPFRFHLSFFFFFLFYFCGKRLFRFLYKVVPALQYFITLLTLILTSSGFQPSFSVITFLFRFSPFFSFEVKKHSVYYSCINHHLTVALDIYVVYTL